MEAVSYTAQWTAAARALETEREGERLIDAPYARAFAGPDGFDLLDKYGGGGLQEFVAIRTRYLDDAILNTLATTDIKQVVLLAAGIDARAFRLQWPDDVVVYELDHAALHEEKQERLNKVDAAPAVERRVVRADLAEDWTSPLVEAGSI